MPKLWRRGGAYIFDVQITDSYAARNSEAPTDKVLYKNEKEKKKKYQEKFWSMRRYFTSLVFTVDGMIGRYERVT